MQVRDPGRRSSQRGLTMIEVLVAIVIISLGLLGMAGLQAASMRGSQSAIYRAQAVQFAADMAERMRGNQGDVTAYDLSLGAAAPSGASVADLDRADWLARVATLPGGTGSITNSDVNGTVTIVVQWDDSRAGGGTQAQYTLVTRVRNNPS